MHRTLAAPAFVLTLLLTACGSGGRGTSPGAAAAVSSGVSHWNEKATANQRAASALVGGFTNNESELYELGIQHIINAHGDIGALTIRQVIDQEWSRQLDQVKVRANLAIALKAKTDEAQRQRNYLTADNATDVSAKTDAEDLANLRAACLKLNQDLGHVFCISVRVHGPVVIMTVSSDAWNRAPDLTAKKSVAYRLGTLWNNMTHVIGDEHLYMYDENGNFLIDGTNAYD